MKTGHARDPRLDPAVVTAGDIRPIVERPRSGLSGTAIGGIAVVAGLLLFGALDARRRAAIAPATAITRADLPAVSAPPPLVVPPPAAEPIWRPSYLEAAPALPPPTQPVLSPRIDPSPPPPTQAQVYESAPQIQPAVPPRTASGSALVMDSSGAPAAGAPAPSAGAGGAPDALSAQRVRAATFANRATTIVQGTLIAAVLETAFDSTSPGFARALVQFDIMGFDGTRVLIPRGSRLIGEYGADTSAGQKRARILWTRLIRPDGVTIAIGSPAADPVGRGGVRADVNTHFLERFGGAILQSTLDVGVALAARASNSPVIVALPNSINGAGSTATRSTDIKPTLRVPAGRSVSVFVARDLDFTEVETRP